MFSGLENLEVILLAGNRLSSLPSGVFSGLGRLRRLHLDGNELTSLQSGLFSELRSLEELQLQGNSLGSLPSGAFTGLVKLGELALGYNAEAAMPLRMELERSDDGAVAGQATARVRLVEGAPFAMTVALEVEGGTLTRNTATIPKGGTVSSEFTATQTPSQALRLSLGTAPDLPGTRCGPSVFRYPCYRGLRVEAGPPLVVFEQVELVLTPVSVSENGGVSTVIATVDPPLPTAFSVEVSAAALAPAVPGDFTLSGSTTLSFPANSRRSTGTVTIAATDNTSSFPPVGSPAVDEKRIVVSGSVSGPGPTAPLPKVLEIRDDETPGVTVSFARTRYDVTEGSSVRVSLVLSADPKREVVIPLDARRRGGASEDDYSEPIPRSVTFASGETTAEFQFEAASDRERESGEEVAVYLSADLPSKVSGRGFVTLAIRDIGGGGGAPPPDDDEDEEDNGDDSGGGGGPPTAHIAVNAECVESLCLARTGVPVRFEDRSTGTVRFRTWDFGDGGRARDRTVDYTWSEPGFYEVTLTVSDGAVESTEARTFLVEAAAPAGTCKADGETLCLRDSRFAVEVEWWTADGKRGRARVVHAGTNDSGLFWFFSQDNWEVLIKVLDGCSLNGRLWVFGASTTDLGYRIGVTDTVTETVREYENEPGRPAEAITDVDAFPESCRP